MKTEREYEEMENRRYQLTNEAQRKVLMEVSDARKTMTLEEAHKIEDVAAEAFNTAKANLPAGMTPEYKFAIVALADVHLQYNKARLIVAILQEEIAKAVYLATPIKANEVSLVLAGNVVSMFERRLAHTIQRSVVEHDLLNHRI